LQLSRAGGPPLIERPESYLLGIALNLAAGRRRSEARQATRREIETLIESVVDGAAQTESVVEARSDLATLETAIEELPPRQRAIFLAVRVREVPIAVVADSLGISRRLVEIELSRALSYCAGRLDRQLTRRFGPKAPNTSYGQKRDSGIEQRKGTTRAKSPKR
jgi:RNA polymerase sigma factor (sigma-70 family)